MLEAFNFETQEVSLRVHLNPTVKLVWTSLVIMVFGALLSLSHRARRRPQATETDRVALRGGLVPGFAVLGLVLLTTFAFSGAAFCSGEVFQFSPQLQEVGGLLRCPTCQGVSVLESETPQARAMRGEISRRLDEGQSAPEILAYFETRYGDWILRSPRATSLHGLLLWGIPIAGLTAGPLALAALLARANRRATSRRRAMETAIRAYLGRTSP